jgi:hypothetical protein
MKQARFAVEERVGGYQLGRKLRAIVKPTPINRPSTGTDEGLLRQ